MAGQPKRRAMREELDKLTLEYFEGDPTQTVLNYVTCQLENGETIASIARTVSKNTGYDIPREWVSNYVHSFPEAAESVRIARPRASHVFAEKALEAVEAQVTTSVEVAQSGNKARQYMRMAEAYDSGSYAQNRGIKVDISVGGLYLRALQQVDREVTGGGPVAVISSPTTPALPAQPKQ